MSSRDEDSVYDEGYFTTVQWLDDGGHQQRQPKPPLHLDHKQRLAWWEGFQDAIENNKDIAKGEARFEGWVMFFIMVLFLLFGMYLLVCCPNSIVKILGAIMVYVSGNILYNQK